MDSPLVLQFDYCAIQDPSHYYPELKLHAPVPLPCTPPQLLQPDFQHYPEHKNTVDEYPTYGANYLDICHIKMESSPAESLQSTFLTPSELLAEMATKDLTDDLGPDIRSESASKARRRIMAKKVGFVPTDPDTISSHEKKRHYLECLEQYILYLHNEFGNLGLATGPIENVKTYPGLSSNSMRILLVHMQNEAKQLNECTLAEEQKFLGLRDQVEHRT